MARRQSDEDQGEHPEPEHHELEDPQTQEGERVETQDPPPEPEHHDPEPPETRDEPPAPPQPQLTKAAKGEKLVKVLVLHENGVEDGKGGVVMPGRTLKVSAATAAMLAMRGSVEIVEE